MIRRAVLILMLLSACGVGAARAMTGAEFSSNWWSRFFPRWSCGVVLLLWLLPWATPSLGDTEITSLPFTASSSGETYYISGDLSYSGSSVGITVSANNITIRGSGAGGSDSPPHKITLTGANSADIIDTGTTTGTTIANIELVRTGGSSFADCIQTGVGSSATLHHVRMYSQNGRTLLLQGTATVESCIGVSAHSTNASWAITGSYTRSFTNCTFSVVTSATIGSGATTTVTNCIWYKQSGTSAIITDSSVSGGGSTTYTRNCYYRVGQSSGSSLVTYNGTTYTPTSITTIDANATSGDPLLLNPDGTQSANWRPKSTSSLVLNNGTNVNAYSTDIGDSTRVISTTIDRGAHERQGAVTPTGACCTPPVAGYGYGTCAVTTEAACSGGGKVYEGDATTCTPLPCSYVPKYAVASGAYLFLDDAAAAAQYDKFTNSANPSYSYVRPMWLSWRNYVVAQSVGDSGDDELDGHQMLWWALLYRLEGNPTWLANAKTERAALSATYERWVLGSSGYAFSGVGLNAQSQLAMAYSFVRGGLSGAERTAWVAPLLAPDEELDAKSGEATDPWRWHCVSIIPALTVTTDGNGSTHDQPKLDALLTHLEDWCGPCLELESPTGYMDNYSGQKGVSQILNATAAENCVPGFGDPLATHLDNGWKFWATRMRGEMRGVASSSDSLPSLERQTGKWNTTDINFLMLMSFYGGARQQPVACAWQRQLYNKHAWPTVTSQAFAEFIWPILLWTNPGDYPSASISDTPKSWIAPYTDIVTTTQGYGLNSANRNIFFGYYPFNLRFVGETPLGGVLYRRGRDNGFWRGGYRIFDQDEMFSPYLNRGVSLNAIRIYDSSESPSPSQYPSVWSGALAVWSGTDSIAPSSCTGLRTRAVPVDGSPYTNYNAQGRARLPECDPNDDAEWTAKGTLLAQDVLDGAYLREVCRQDSAHAPAKQAGVYRSVSHLWDATVLVLDEVANKKAATPVLQDWHTINICRVNTTDANITRVSGAADIPVDGADTRSDPPGGVYTATVANGQYIYTENGASLFVARPLFAGTLVAGDVGTLQLVGGPNSAGTHFKQGWKLNDVNTYSADPSYEWHVPEVSRNYLPGGYACVGGTLLADGVHYGVSGESAATILSDPPTIRMSNGTESKGKEAATWTGSVKIAPSAANDTVLIVTAIWGGSKSLNAAGRPNLPVQAYAKRGGTLAFLYDANDAVGAQSLKMSIQRMPRFAGQRLKSFSWTKPTGGFSTPATIAHTAFGVVPGREYSITIDSDGNGSYDLAGGTYTADAEGVLLFSASYSDYVSARADTIPTVAGTGACCSPDGTCSILSGPACTGSGGSYQGDGELCDPNPCPQPLGACCLSSGGCLLLTEDECNDIPGTWQGMGTVCSPTPCPQPVRACCFEDGSCSLLSIVPCTAQGGVYHGTETSCSPNPCPQPVTMGACCVDGVDCFDLSLEDCISAGGVFMGEGTACFDPPDCGSTIISACCLPSDVCVVTTHAICLASGGDVQVSESCDLSCDDLNVYGACCAVDGSCYILTEANCTIILGTYQGDSTTCVSDPCAGSVGACCFPNESCIVTTEAACGGVWLGDTDCDPNPCAAPARYGGRGDERPGAGLGRTRWLGR